MKIRELGSESSGLVMIRWVAAAWILGLAYCILFYPPYWALMDDHGQIQAASSGFEGLNLVQYVTRFLRDDFSWGMFRPVYAIFIYLFYGTFHNSSQLGYLVVFSINVFIFWIWAILIERSIQKFSSTISNFDLSFYKWLFFVFCFLFSPNYTLFFFASLQERLILLFGALMFFGAVQSIESNAFQWQSLVFLFSGILLALLSKASSLFLIPPFVVWMLAQFFRTKNKRFLIVSVALIVLFSGFGYFFMSIRGHYTSDYKTEGLIYKMFHAGRRFSSPFWFSILTIVTSVTGWKILSKKNDFTQTGYLLIWPLLLLCFLAIMLPWRMGINYYLIVPGGLFWTGCKIINCFLLIEFLRRLKLFKSWPLPLIVGLIALGVSIPSARKFIHTARQHHGTGVTVQFLKQELTRYADSELMIRMPPPCLEASDSVSVYLGRPKLVKLYSNGEFSENVSPNVKRQLFIINGECREIPSEFSTRKTLLDYWPWAIYERINT